MEEQIARCRDDVSLTSVMSHPTGAVPVSIFHTDGTMRKINKGELGHQLEAQAEKVTELPACATLNAIYIRDVMAVIQMIAGDKFHAFDGLAAAYLRQVLKGFDKADTDVEVFDRYDCSNSVKTAQMHRHT